jgi:hypothetical protein
MLTIKNICTIQNFLENGIEEKTAKFIDLTKAVSFRKQIFDCVNIEQKWLHNSVARCPVSSTYKLLFVH